MTVTNEQIQQVLQQMAALPGQAGYLNLPAAGEIANLLQAGVPVSDIVAARAAQIAAAGNPYDADTFNHAGSANLHTLMGIARIKGISIEQEMASFYAQNDPYKGLPKTFDKAEILARASASPHFNWAGMEVQPSPQFGQPAPPGIDPSVFTVVTGTGLYGSPNFGENDLKGKSYERFLYEVTGNNVFLG